jgi:hypothetical protein
VTDEALHRVRQDQQKPTSRLERLVQYIVFLSENKCWNNGTWTVRDMRGKTQMSVHATGRAADISWRKMPDGRGSNDWWTLHE